MKGIIGTDPLVEMPQVAFVGRSNVGKSSLMNSLLGQKDLVKTGKTPGKTQEINYFLVNSNYYFVDVPGYGFAQMPQVERAKLEKLIVWYLSLPLPLRKVVLVIDSVVGPTGQDVEVYNTLRDDDVDVIVVANKIDKLGRNDALKAVEKIKEILGEDRVIPYSSLLKEGRNEVLACL